MVPLPTPIFADALSCQLLRRVYEVEGVMTHGRNLDFSMTEYMRPDTIVVDLTKGNRTLSATTGRLSQIVTSAVLTHV